MLPVVRFLKLGAAQALTASLLGSVALFGCSLKTASKGTTLSLVLPNPGAHGLVSFGSGRVGLAPAAWTGFACYGVNVVGPGIADSSANPKPAMTDFSELIAGTKSCAYRGVVSNPFSFPAGGGDVQIDVQVPAGAGRIVQLIGITDSNYCANNFLEPVSGSTPGAYEIGHVVADLFGDATVTIPITYTAAESKRVDCSSGVAATVLPAVTFTSPAPASYLYLANSGSFSLSGTCSELAEPVIIGLNGGAFTTVNCDAGNVWTVPSGTLFTSLSDGVLNFTADHSGPNGVATQVALTITKDTVTPVGATALAWGQVIPFNSLNVSASWTRSLAGDLYTQSIQFYSDGTCTAAYGSAVSLSSVAATQSFTAPADGSYSYKVTSFETAGNSAPSLCSPMMTIDTVAPSGQSLSINSGATYTTSGAVTLTLAATGASEMYITNTAGCASGGTWITYSTGAGHTLGVLNTTATVYAKFRDAALNETACISDAIIHDNTAPSVAITNPSANSYINTTSLTAFSVSGTCTENGQNVSISGDASATVPCTSGVWSASLNFTAASQGSVSIYADHFDAAGNAAVQNPRAFIKDTIAPTVAVTSPNLGSEVWVHNTFENITWSTSDVNPGTNTISLAYSIDGGTSWISIASLVANTSPYAWSVPAVAASLTAKIKVVYVDAAGNSASDVSDATFKIVGVPAQIAFSPPNASAPTLVNADSCYGPLMVQSLDANGLLSNVATATVVSLNGATLVDFYAGGDSTCTGAILSNTSIAVATYQTPVYYRGISIGTGNVTAMASGLVTGQRSMTSTTAPGSWAYYSTSGPGTIRTSPSAVWNSITNQLMIWGGFDGSYLNTGGTTSGTTTWTPISVTAAPLARKNHSAVVTSSGQMVVWGGMSGTYPNGMADGGTLSSGGTWGIVGSSGSVPTARYDHSAVITSSDRMIVWGGYSTGYLATGAYLDTPSNFSWSPTMTSPLTGRAHHVAVWDQFSARMIIWGGTNGIPLGDGARYDPSGNTWALMSSTGAPAARYDAAAVMAGSKLFVWGGFNTSGELGDGAIYDPTTDVWTPVNPIGAPRIRGAAKAAWNGSKVFVWGGSQAGTNLLYGALYDPVTDTWESTTQGGGPANGGQLPWIFWNGIGSFLVYGGTNSSNAGVFTYTP